MTETQQLLARVETLAERLKMAPSTLGRDLFGNGQRYRQIKDGGSLTLAMYERAVIKIADLEKTAPAAAS